MRHFRIVSGMLLAGIALLTGATSHSFAQQASAKPMPFQYTDYMQQFRQAARKLQQQKDANQREDPYPVIAFIQGEGYPKAIAEAAKRGRDEDLLALYKAKWGTQWPRTVAGTPLLCYAAMNGDAAVVKTLVARGADVNVSNAENWTPLHNAAEYGGVEIIKMLLDKGADVNAGTARFGETPLMLACGLYGGGRITERGSGLDCARLLLKRGAKINAATKDGEIALRYAVSLGQVALVRLLLAQGADAAMKDVKGRDALDDISEFERIEPDGKITFTQDSTSVPTYKLTVFEALIKHGKVRPGLYISPEVERKVEADALSDFLTIIHVLRDAMPTQP